MSKKETKNIVKVGEEEIDVSTYLIILYSI